MLIEKYFKKNYLYIACLFVFILFATIASNLNIHGDGKIHALIAKESFETGQLLDHAPYLIYDFVENNRVYVPISYPLTSEAVFSIFYLIGGEGGFKLYSPLIAVTIFILIYLCIKEIGIYEATVISTVGILSISERIIMTPLIEPYLVMTLLAGIFFLKKYVQLDEPKYLYLSAFFLGVASSTKQLGLLTTLAIISFFVTYLTFQRIKQKENFERNIKRFIIFLLILLCVSGPALIDQINRTGTIAFAPGSIKISKSIPFHKTIEPLLKSRFESKPAALEARDKLISYTIKNRGIKETLNSFLLSPFVYYRSDAVLGTLWFYNYLANFLIIIIIVLIISKNEFVRKNIFFLSLVLFLLIEEMIISYAFHSPIHQYQNLGIVLAVILTFSAIFSLTRDSKFMRAAVLLPLIILFAYGYYSYVIPLWSKVGREDSYHLEGYKMVGEFVQKNIPENSIFLASETMFRYYAKRDVITMNESTGDVFQKIVTSTDEDQVVRELKSLHVDYVVINRSQVERKGLYDYFPANGLISIIDNSERFTKIFDPYYDGEIVIYKVNYDI